MDKIFNFYGRRKGKGLSSKLQGLVEDYLPDFLITEDFSTILKQQSQYHDKYLEIGFGYGEHLADKAQNHSLDLFVGAEPYVNGIASLLEKIKERNINNIFIFNDDVRKLFASIPCDFFDGIFILFPDPWHKRCHNNRRIINKENLDNIIKFLKTGGFIRFVSDDENYKNWVWNILKKEPRFKILNKIKKEGILEKVVTRYCKKAMQQGKDIFYIDIIKV